MTRQAKLIWLMHLIGAKIREKGLIEATRRAVLRLSERPEDRVPIGRTDKGTWFNTDTALVRALAKERMRSGIALVDPSHVDRSYPEAFEFGGRVLRYAYLPAEEAAKGLVVLFHSFDALHHLGPPRRWRHFDLLAPWDTFGFKRQGSWFWGERGDPFVATLVAKLVESVRQKTPQLPWFTMGGSMGGFGALYHGITLGSDGIYTMAPQVDLRRKVEEYAAEGPENPYGHLVGPQGSAFPDILADAEKATVLPPLFLMQNQYDSVNPYAEHASRLLQVYDRKRAWYGLRLYPAIGHSGDASPAEADTFFTLLVEKGLPKRMSGEDIRTGNR